MQRYLHEAYDEKREVEAPVPREDEAGEDPGSEAPAAAAEGLSRGAGDAETQAPTLRVLCSTSSLEDWLWRGDDPVLYDMHWQVYSMWVYRIEKPPAPQSRTAPKRPRFIDIEFSKDYELHGSHLQRLSTLFL